MHKCVGRRVAWFTLRRFSTIMKLSPGIVRFRDEGQFQCGAVWRKRFERQ